MWVFFTFFTTNSGGVVHVFGQPVIWSPLSAGWHDVSSLHVTVSLQGLGNPLRVHVKIWRLWKKVPSLRDNYSMEVDLLKYSHTSHERANIVNLFQWHDGQHCCETDKEGIFTCEWSYCVLHVCWESFDIFIESGLFRLGGAQISGGKKYEARTLPFKVYMVKLLAEHCGKGKRWVYVAWYVHATLWKIPMVGWDLLGAFLAYLDSTVHPYCMQIFVSM